MDAVTQTVQNLECPLCCKNVFETKEDLVNHLTQLLTKISCPICKQNFQSVQGLVDHLNTAVCHPPDDVVFDDDSQSSVATYSSTATRELTETRKVEKETNTTDSLLSMECKSLEGIEDNGEVGKMYAELMEKQLLKSDWHTEEVRLVQQSGANHYVFLSSSEVGLDGDTVVTKNNDGTISLTTLEDMKVEAVEPVVSDDRTQTETEEEGKEYYSCNTCGISFTSVLEHIENYHNDQEVVVEEPAEYSTMEFESVTELQAPKRVILETGEIVEAADSEAVAMESPVNIKQELDVAKQTNSKHYIKVEKYCDTPVKRVNKSDVKYKCPHCPVIYSNSKSLCAHMKVHKLVKNDVEKAVQFLCEVCNTTFQTNKSLKLHKRMHDPLKIARPIEAPVTNEGTPRKMDMFLCSVCDKLIPIDYRTIHQNSHQKDNDKLNCDVCNKKFSTPEYLEMHTNVHNMERVTLNNPDKELPYSCLYCHRKFSRPHEKVKHERIHTGEKPHSCEICGKSFRVSYCLTLHMRTHTGARPYACPHCPKRFKAHSVYNHHILTHSEVRAYKCPYCAKAFKTSVQLAGHKNSHTKPFSCQQCNRPFASLYAVRVHTETHSRHNNLKFSCNECGASYARASALKDHTKQAHGGEASALIKHKQHLKEWIIKVDETPSISNDSLLLKESVPINNEAWLNCT